MRILMVLTSVFLATFALLTLLSLPALAAYPGANGRIAFVSNRDDDNRGNLEIYTMNPDGSDVQRLTAHRLPDEEPAWSPNGKKIAYTGSLGADRGVIVMNADGSQPVKVTSGSFFYPSGSPSWSPDGMKIVYQRYDEGSGRTDLHVVNADGTGDAKLTSTPDIGEFHPAWSPDGAKIAFSHFVPPCPNLVCNFEIFVMNRDGSGKTRLTFDGDQDTAPDWSPDGTELVWGNLNGTTEIQVMNADGSDQRSFSPAARGYQPGWSPDGTQIVWSGFGPPPDFFGGNEINVMNADGSDQHAISRSSSFDVQPDWQPLNRPPDCSGAGAAPSFLLPANRKFTLVFVRGVTDPDGDPAAITIDGVTQDEPVTANGDPTAPDAAAGGQPDRVSVRAERNPQGDGRVYTIAFTASDGRGGTCSGVADVSVPRHKDDPAVNSAPPSYDSFGG